MQLQHWRSPGGSKENRVIQRLIDMGEVFICLWPWLAGLGVIVLLTAAIERPPTINFNPRRFQ